MRTSTYVSVRFCVPQEQYRQLSYYFASCQISSPASSVYFVYPRNGIAASCQISSPASSVHFVYPRNSVASCQIHHPLFMYILCIPETVSRVVRVRRLIVLYILSKLSNVITRSCCTFCIPPKEHRQWSDLITCSFCTLYIYVPHLSIYTSLKEHRQRCNLITRSFCTF